MVCGQCCSGGVPISGTLGLSVAEKQDLQLQLTYDYNTLRDLFEGDELFEDQTRRRNTHSMLLEINYGLTQKWSASALLTGVRQERRISATDGSIDFTSTNGIGDAILLLKYAVIKAREDRRVQWTIGIGPKMPLGRTNFTGNLGIALPADMQPGSGAWDLMFWSSLEKYSLINPNLNFSFLTTYRHSGTNPSYFGSETYRFGREYAGTAQLSYRFLIGQNLMDALMALRYRRQSEDVVNGGILPNSGGQFVYLIPGLNFNPSPKLAVRTSAYVPLYREVIGTQVATSYKLIASINWTITTKKQDNISTTRP